MPATQFISFSHIHSPSDPFHLFALLFLLACLLFQYRVAFDMVSAMVLFNLLQTLGGILGLLESATDSQAKLRISKHASAAPAKPFISSLLNFRTVPLGDSITAITCWRTLLWDALRDANLSDRIQFVGSSTSDAGACIGTGPWDHHHEGHSGYTAVDIARNDLAGWLRAARPDVVMFMLGTNDVTHGHATAAIIDAYTQMVGEMRGSNPGMRIIVSWVWLCPC